MCLCSAQVNVSLIYNYPGCMTRPVCTLSNLSLDVFDVLVLLVIFQRFFFSVIK